ncbi:hypothetical protein [Thermoactinomyces daqus]|nr:hypothetical protein [Thermoactinomyces daqus]
MVPSKHALPFLSGFGWLKKGNKECANRMLIEILLNKGDLPFYRE